MATIIDTLKNKYHTGSMPVKLIFINTAIFLLLRICAIICTFSGNNTDTVILKWIEMPSSPAVFLTRPWTVITYMFSQYDVLHILFNMLWLYWFGSVFLFTGNSRQMLALYLYGGICGALLYFVSYNLLPVFDGINGWLIGSSASVLAIVSATAMRHPNYKMGILFIGEISLKWIVMVIIAIDLMSISGTNAGGHIAHLGGAFAGFIWALALNNGRDITRPLNALLDYFVNLWHKTSKKGTYRSSYRHNQSHQNHNAKSDMETLDEILDKIKKSGYTSLTAEEKRRLFDVSSRMK